MQPKRSLHLYNTPLTQTALVTALVRVPKATIVFYTSDLQLEIEVLQCKPVGIPDCDAALRRDILDRVKKFQPIANHMPGPIWGVY